MNQTDATPTLKLKRLPASAGVESIADALPVPRAARLVWLDIPVNEQFDLTVRQDCPVVQEADVKACRWDTASRSGLEATFSRPPLPHTPGPIDFRARRTCAEALSFVTHR